MDSIEHIKAAIVHLEAVQNETELWHPHNRGINYEACAEMVIRLKLMVSESDEESE